MTNARAPASLVGGGILGLITTGLYNNPLAIYREYIQNSADAVASDGRQSGGKVEIEIDPSAMQVRVRDDGPGLSRKDVEDSLLTVARSNKQQGADRGFRGIGRLSGLAFAESVTFTTRACKEEPVSRVAWNGCELREGLQESERAEQVISGCVKVETLAGAEYPDHFFEVEIKDVARHAAGLLLDREAVRAYIAETCPVPMDDTFQYAEKAQGVLVEGSPLTLRISINDDDEPIVRPYKNQIRFSESREARYTEFEEIRVPVADGEKLAAVGWVAHSSYLGAIPKDAGVRGLRAREGNIQIGDETVFDALFPESRFNRWCVGEVHILDPRIVPNARRDYFEPSPHTRNLENRLSAVCHSIAGRCRQASAGRNKGRRIVAAVQRMEETYELASSGYLEAGTAVAMVDDALQTIPTIRGEVERLNGEGLTDHDQVDELERTMKGFRPKKGRPPFPGLIGKNAAAYRKVFGVLARLHGSPREAKRLIEAILAYE